MRDQDGVFRNGKKDKSPIVLSSMNLYEEECSCCYLGFAHTVECHHAKVAWYKERMLMNSKKGEAKA